ncbi:hypothetical protein EVJ58_g7934 [Rhodofomes roseus]|uniref:Uncharacterized protein n=1 Tax=Rhodofomes roseus TaxID=34475 RepID=A0A4Y9Y1I8_9APHY|nr:hypothetical protein EVJ58_g7934 [Rhodofomes roseus]
MFKQFTSVETLRLDHLVWSHVDAAAVIELASQAAHLHLSNLSFTYGDDMVHLLSSSPRRSSLHMQEYLSQGQMFRTSPKMIPVHREVHIGRLVTDLDLFTTVHLVMREAYVTRCAFGMTIDRLDISGDGQVLAGITSGGHWHDLIQRKQTWLKMWLDFLKLGARSRGLDEGDLPTLDIKSLRIPASTILRRITFGSMYLNTLLDLRIFLARRMHFILDGLDPKDAIPKRCADLDHALVRLVTNGPRIDIIFDAHCPAERLADWIGAISACFPALVARGTRVGMVCTSGEDMDGERPPVAQRWWS